MISLDAIYLGPDLHEDISYIQHFLCMFHLVCPSPTMVRAVVNQCFGNGEIWSGLHRSNHTRVFF